jgi:signal transduction histidine kinase
MKLRYKLWFLIIFMMVATIIVINIIVNNVLINSYESLENKKVSTNLERYTNALNNEIIQLDAAVGDWSAWDDTYQFLGGENNEFPASNINNDTMTNLRTDVMIYAKTSGIILYEIGFDYSEQKMMKVSPSLNGYIYKNSSLINFVDLNSSINGILQLPEGPILIASRPVISSDRTGPIRGAVIWGRYLDSYELNFLSKTVNMSVSIVNFNNETSPLDFREAALSLINGNDTFIKPLNSEYVAGYSTIKDLFGNPVILIKITMERDIYQQGIFTIQYFQASIIILTIVVSLTLIIFLEKTLLSRLNILSKQVVDIGKKSNFSARLKISGKDELNNFANVANETFQMIENINNTLEQKVLERTNKIDLLLKQKDEFINQLGHDLKNPLNPLINLLPILEKNVLDQKNKEIISVLVRNANYMKNLVIKTIELGKLNSPNLKFYFEDINLLKELNTVIDNNKIMLNENHIEIKNNLSDTIIVNVDKLRFDELLNNLLNNAMKYTNGAGTITIDAKQDTNSVTVSMKDTGVGMSNDQLNKIFVEFYKADTSRHDFDSSGLGLSICKRIVERHNGKIWAESEGLGKGSTFYFTVPRNELKNQSTPMEDIYNEIDKINMMEIKNKNLKIKRSDLK